MLWLMENLDAVSGGRKGDAGRTAAGVAKPRVETEEEIAGEGGHSGSALRYGSKAALVQEDPGVFQLDPGRDATGKPVVNTLGAVGAIVEQLGYLGRSAKALDETTVGGDLLPLGVGQSGVLVAGHARSLNAALSERQHGDADKSRFQRKKLNTEVNGAFMHHSSPPPRMEEMHASMVRLLDFARQATKGQPGGVESFADIGARLGVSSAVLTNWKARGISKEGALSAERKFGCSAHYLLTGDGPTVLRTEANHEDDHIWRIAELLDDIAHLPADQRARAINAALVAVRAVPAATSGSGAGAAAPPTEPRRQNRRRETAPTDDPTPTRKRT